MPILKHAKKKLRQDKKRTTRNKGIKEAYKESLKAAKLEKSPEAMNKAFSTLDKAAKNHLIHKNKASRLKAAIAKLLAPTPIVAKEAKPAKTPKASKATPKTKSKKEKSAKPSTKK